MFRGNRKYIFILGLCFTLLVLLQILRPRPIDWRISYMKKDEAPFGASAIHSALGSIFPGQTILIENHPLYNALEGKNLPPSNYIIINETFQPDKLDSRELLEFVDAGNNAFIAANYFNGHFADTLKLETDNFLNLGNTFANDSAALANIYKVHDSVTVDFTSPFRKNQTPFSFSKGFENSYFSSFDTSLTRALGKNSDGEINFIQLKWGKGNLYLCCLPEAFSNYHFVNRKTKDYAYTALSFLPVRTVIWDEYYKIGNVAHDSALRVIFSHPALKTAYLLALVSLLLFMIIGIKRKQRAIPVIEPLRNTTLQFVDVVGTLYYQTGNHKNIAEKKIAYFLEYIRGAFQVKTNLYDDSFIDRISNLSGIEREKVHALFYYFDELSVRNAITEQQLLKLNKMIEDFHKANKR